MSSRSNGHNSTLRRILRRQYGSDDTRDSQAGAFPRVELWQVNNWNALFSSRRLVTSLTCYIIFMVSQLVLSYVGLLYFDVENRPIIFVVAQIYNIIASYFFPMVIAGAVDESIERPFEDLEDELNAYRVFLVSILAQPVGLILGIWTVVAIFRSEVAFILVDYDFINRQTRRRDVTIFFRFYQLISVNLTALTLVAALGNWWVTKDKIERYLNRTERTQEPFDEMMSDDFYGEYIKTTRSK